MSTLFYKVQGAGNDFIVFIDKDNITPDMVKSLCHRFTGIGADGVVNLFKISEGLFQWDFYNSDGSRAEMCGNAARCVVKLTAQLYGYEEIDLKTEAGIVRGRTSGENIQVDLILPIAEPQKIEKPFNGKYDVGYLVQAGVPHFVIPVDQPWELGAEENNLAKFIRTPLLGPNGANLTFVNLQTTPLQTVSLERGVEKFTLACGTGVIATARVFMHLYKTEKNIQISAPGGNFVVSFHQSTATLEGPAEIVFKGEL
jgi:diaminopimelate epimerase